MCKFFEENELEFIKRYSFNSNKYPAINIKISNNQDSSLTTCAIFRSGSIMITGGTDIKVYKFIYDKFLNLLNDSIGVLQTTPW